MSEGNGHGRIPVEILDLRFPPSAGYMPLSPKRRPIWPALILFLLTVISTLAVGAEFAVSYAQNREPFSGDQNPRSEEHTSELQSLRHLVFLPSFPTRRSSDLSCFCSR